MGPSLSGAIRTAQTLIANGSAARYRFRGRATREGEQHVASKTRCREWLMGYISTSTNGVDRNDKFSHGCWPHLLGRCLEGGISQTGAICVGGYTRGSASNSPSLSSRAWREGADTPSSDSPSLGNWRHLEDAREITGQHLSEGRVTCFLFGGLQVTLLKRTRHVERTW